MNILVWLLSTHCLTNERKTIMWPIRAAYGIIGCFFVAERLLRQGESAKSLQEGQADRGSTRAIGAALERVLESHWSLCEAQFTKSRRFLGLSDTVMGQNERLMVKSMSSGRKIQQRAA